LGPYEILAPLGAGGMGEVYRGRDTKLDREVAVKVLPAALAHDPERLARFEREAKVLASLNHSNIAQIYGVQEADGYQALVMELVPGRTLAEAIGVRGQASGVGKETGGRGIPLQAALGYASQIVDALSAAHDKGITHRDLKPANIMITPEGVVKVLDFGLAAVAPNSSPDAHAGSEAPTLTMSPTSAGMIMGTAPYMSPEQARGQQADRRSDIWSFGVVLYEMLTGQRLFRGDTVSDILASVLKEEPNLESVPEKVRPLLKKCLEKEPKKRLQAIGDWDLLLDHGAGSQPAPFPQTVHPSRFDKIAVSAAIVILAVIAAWGWSRRPAESRTPQRFAFTIAPPVGTTFALAGDQASAPLVSPDGTSVVYALDSRGGLRLQRFDSAESEAIVGSEGLNGTPWWSPDSKSVVMMLGLALKRMRVPGGALEAMSAVPGPTRGGSWSDKGTVLFTSSGDRQETLYSVPANAGTAQQVHLPNVYDAGCYQPEFLPGGEDFLVAVLPTESETAEIFLASLRDGKAADPVLLMKNDTMVHYTPSGGGRVLFVRDSNLYARKLNVAKRTLEGEAELLERGVASAPEFVLPLFSVSRSGAVVWRSGGVAASQLVTFNRQGKQIGTTGPPLSTYLAILSPDEKHVLVSGALLETDRPGRIGLGGWVGQPDWLAWSPDGTKLLGVRGKGKVIERDVSGAGDAREVRSVPDMGRIEDVSPDGKTILYRKDGSSVYSTSLDKTSDSTSRRMTLPNEPALNARFSPDGRWVLYRARSGNQDLGIYIQPFPGPGLRKQISPGGAFPVWRRDGREILFYDQDRIWSIRVQPAGAELHFGAPEPLFPVRRPRGTVVGMNPLAVSRDGSRIYFPQAIEQPEADVIHVRTGL
jgi:serine/threonine protein kinase